jgi:EAL domain-containing protein (putative c-di-GMP-specific phosphodiesterase class I)
MRQIWMAYQPIVDNERKKVFGHEALLRSRSPKLGNPMALIAAAERQGAMRELSRAIRRQVAATASAHEGFIFVNLHASDLEDPDLFDPAAPLSAIAHRVVLEITERASLQSVPAPAGKIRALKALGYRVALDDLGAGWAGLSYIAELEPDFVKIDRGLVTGVHEAPRRHSIIRAVVSVCAQLGMGVIGEGVETKAEREALSEAGCKLMQGYFFGRPSADVSKPNFGD